MGFIYKITAPGPAFRIFVGRTSDPISLDDQWKLLIKMSRKNLRNDFSVLCNAIKKFGEKNFKLEILIESDSLIELIEKEKEYIISFRSMVPYGMNKNPDIVLDKVDIVVSEADIEKYLVKTETGYIVTGHPMGPEKVYGSKLKTYDQKYKKALKYIFKLNQLTEPIVVVKKEYIPEITKRRNGYSVKIGNQKARYFVTKGESIENLYKQALEYLKISKSAVQRLNGNGNRK